MIAASIALVIIALIGAPLFTVLAAAGLLASHNAEISPDILIIEMNRLASSPNMIAWFPEVAALLGIRSQQMENPLSAQVFSGNHLLEGMYPYAACYGGHQFGHWAGQLGDGRAIGCNQSPPVVAEGGSHDGA